MNAACWREGESVREGGWGEEVQMAEKDALPCLQPFSLHSLGTTLNFDFPFLREERKINRNMKQAWGGGVMMAKKT